MTSPNPPGIVEFITARLDEEEHLAKAATQAPWWYRRDKMWLAGEDFVAYDLSKGEEYVGYGDPPCSGCIATTGPANDPQSMADAAHIVAQDPARTLRRVEALRAIVAIHQPRRSTEWVGDACGACGDFMNPSEIVYAPCPTLRALTWQWSDHSDFQPEWSLT